MNSKEKTVFQSVIIALILWIPNIAAVLLSGSVTMLADVVKDGNEILATFLAWIVLRKVSQGKSGTYDYGMGKFETIIGFITGVVMFISLFIVFYSGIWRILAPEPIQIGGSLLGIGIYCISICANTRTCLKSHRIAKIDASPIMDSQWRLFRNKAISDALVIGTLIASLVFHEFWWSWLFDPISSLLIGIILFLSGYHIIKSSFQDLLDKTIDESFQFLILQDLVEFFDEYIAFHGMKSRLSGNNVYIEIFLEFDDDRKMGEVQDIIDRMKSSIEQKIERSTISIVPSRGFKNGDH
ncbi:MAG: cation diffusion facilitator family transporter [Methanospirillum sp.]|uniref:cation diffusion facilitator family transporter n=1 Tax=Methanospirillum sp. TaxID=45200 RepID=UPI0023692FB8|nr:cation diffusion facilitator family transporter [Methanospirillum sp.]MDD1728987.1 cation diffusion facilitator family transporter [Methanospirillum sp.]